MFLESAETTRVVGSSAPFDSIESAHEYVSLLLETVHDTKASIAEDTDYSHHEPRRVDALHLVGYKLSQLEGQLSTCRRILNDLRLLRRLLLDERGSVDK
jgi:hypothetical protein